MLRFSVLAVTVVTMLPAQRPHEGVRVVLGSQVVDAESHLVVHTIPVRGDYPRSERLGPFRWVTAGRFVDTARAEVLEITAERVALATLDGKPSWAVERRATHTAFAIGAHQCVLAGDRIVMPAGGERGGLVALDRSTGAIAWERPGVPSETIAVDDGLIVTTGATNGPPRLAAQALDNGASAFDLPLRAAPRALVVAPHGIAVVGDAGFTVFDRAGPELWKGNERPVALVANADGWFTATWQAVTAWSRTGEVKWTTELAVGDFEQIVLVALPGGGVAHVRFLGMADSGFEVVGCDARGGIAWRRQEPGLGVSHSKYWHRVEPFVVGERLFVTSQGAGGAFFVEFDPANGDRLGRAAFDMK